jgi:UDP-N-acetylmuramoylalanine--D-glutamate ligase
VRGRLVRAGREITGDSLTLEGSWIVRRVGGLTDRVFDSARLLVPGTHNITNAIAACACALELGASPEGIARGLASFRGVPHRLELVGEVGGVRFFNDSKATTPEAAAVGVTAFGERVIPILGGYDKGVWFEEMARVIAGGVRWAALIGATAPAIRSALDAAGIDSTVFDTFEEAFRACTGRARPGDIVLLSPGCASYDMFNNYEERGEAFRELVQSLEKQAT